MSKNYAYVRVSSVDQKLARQIEAVKKWQNENKVEIHEVFKDKQSGKDFEREQYQNMKRQLQEGDLVVIKSIDRLGRNYDMIIQEWQDITRNIKAAIVVIDMPLLDTRKKIGNELTGKFISDLVLQVLSYVAENERQNIKIRQMEGIKIAKEKGIKFGRKETYDEVFKKRCQIDFENGMRLEDVAKKNGCSKDRCRIWSNECNWDKEKHHNNLLALRELNQALEEGK